MRPDDYIDAVLEKCKGLKRSGLWGAEPQVRPRAWLDNFPDAHEKVLAAVLLDNFTHYASRPAHKLIAWAFQKLEDSILQGTSQFSPPTETTVTDLSFTPVEGEKPRPTDSGRRICAHLRNLAGIADEQFVVPAEALRRAIAGGPIVFVDDFIASGSQLLNTWRHQYQSTHPRSFAEAHAIRPFATACVASLATEYAVARIHRDVPALTVVTAHTLGSDANVQSLTPPGLTTPFAHLSRDIERLLVKYSTKLQLDSYMKQKRYSVYGFHELGMLLAFDECVPDSTLPLFWATGSGRWTPLVSKT